MKCWLTEKILIWEWVVKTESFLLPNYGPQWARNLAHGVAMGAWRQVLSLNPRRECPRAWPLSLGIVKPQVQGYGFKFNMIPHNPKWG